MILWCKLLVGTHSCTRELVFVVPNRISGTKHIASLYYLLVFARGSVKLIKEFHITISSADAIYVQPLVLYFKLIDLDISYMLWANNTLFDLTCQTAMHIQFIIVFFNLVPRASHLTAGSGRMRDPALHTAGAREIWIDQSGFSRWEKTHCPHVNVSWQERHWNQATFLLGDCIKYSLKRIYSFQNHFTLQKVKNMKPPGNILCLQASNLAPNSSSSSVAM